MDAEELVIARGLELMTQGYSWARVISTLGLTPGLTMYTLKERWDKVVLGNYVKLEPGIPKRLHLTSYVETNREITDPETKLTKTIHVWAFRCDQEDGVPVNKEFSVSADALAVQLQPMLPNNAFANWILEVTKVGSGRRAEFPIRWIAR
jgi:hypothetical protein